MLAELHVRNLGVIANLSLELSPGMTALTGETGAGKTLVVEALQLVLGGKADGAMVRAGSDEATVEARFVLGDLGARAGGHDSLPHGLRAGLAASGGDGPDGAGAERILARAVVARGRSKAWIDGRMAPVSALAEAGDELVDIHGQHEHQSLLRPGAARRALDVFGGIDVSDLQSARTTLRTIASRLAELGGDDRQRAREVEVLTHQLSEIEEARLGNPHEDVELAAEEDRLAQMAALRLAAATALRLLDGDDADDDGARGAVDRAARLLGEHEPLGRWQTRAASVAAELGDVASDLRDVLETWEEDPARLAEVQARRRLLADLRRLYAPTIEGVLAHADGARGRLAALAAVEEEAGSLAARRIAAEGALAAAERQVGAARRAAATEMGERLAARLRSLAMPSARLEVVVGEAGAGEDVVLHFGPNPGEPMLPLARIASGGELARAMLALRLVTAGGPPTMVFDEVDAGVGGEAALALGRALREVGTTHQVLVVTHLPQVAAMAHHHIAVRKDVVGERTVTAASTLTGDDRVTELSRMLSGHPDSVTARAHARELLEMGGR